MKSPVEARSLSSLTTLASNPPKYPRNPTEETRKPLVLYIARVPGSRDVFLTTMKPREKVVTAEDVTSSLYYLHVDQASDGGSSFSESESQEIDRQMRYSSASDGERKVNRKPVPSDSSSVLAPSLPTRPRSATVPSELKEDTTWHGRNHSDEGLGSSSSSVGVDNVKAVRRKPVENASHVGSGSMQNVTTTMMMTGLEERRRQPLGPRPLPSRQGPPVYEHSGRENSRMTNFEPGPPLPPRKNVGGGIQPLTPLNPTSEPSFWGPDTPSPDRTPRQAQQDHHSPSRPPQNISSDLSSITLIRRDPSSGAQWNVGKMLVSSTRASSSSQSQNTSPSRHRRRSSPSTSSPPILIEILNPGYNKFLDSHKATTTGFSSSSTSNIATAAAAELRRISAISEYGLNNNERVFRRQIVGETVRSWFTTSRNKRRSGSERDMTDDGVGGGSASGGGTLLDPESTPRKGRYAYLSPWDGQCEFYTGASGRNLKCKHTLPNDSTDSPKVSELRFNLPIFPSLLNKDKDKDINKSSPSSFGGGGGHSRKISGGSGSTASNLSDELNQPSPPPPSSKTNDSNSPQKKPRTRTRFSTHLQQSSVIQSSLDKFSERIDRLGVVDNIEKISEGIKEKTGIDITTLGQEKAGGGTSGKQAKLGKLIIYDEGLKMLDLTVATNLSVWWRVWERVDLPSSSSLNLSPSLNLNSMAREVAMDGGGVDGVGVVG